MPHWRVIYLALMVAELYAAAGASAQAHPPVAVDNARDSVRTDGRLFTAAEARAAAFTGIATIALIPFDQRITGAFRERWPQQTRILRDGAQAFNALGDPGTVLVSLGMYAAGRAAHAEHLTDLGLHTTEALLLSGAATWALKGLAGRQRPYLDLRDADDFTLGRGFSSGARASLPSGHTSAAFAVASAVTAETRHWWPGAPWITGPLLYGGAGVVGLARIYDAKHWASDVVLGAGLGTIAGLSVVRYNHARPHNRLDRMLGGRLVLAPGPGGTMRIGWTVATSPAPR